MQWNVGMSLGIVASRMKSNAGGKATAPPQNQSETQNMPETTKPETANGGRVALTGPVMRCVKKCHAMWKAGATADDVADLEDLNADDVQSELTRLTALNKLIACEKGNGLIRYYPCDA